MIIVDNALQAREAQGKPIRVGMIGAGFMGRGLANQIVNSRPGHAAGRDLQPARSSKALDVYRLRRARRAPGRDDARTTSRTRSAPASPS